MNWIIRGVKRFLAFIMWPLLRTSTVATIAPNSVALDSMPSIVSSRIPFQKFLAEMRRAAQRRSGRDRMSLREFTELRKSAARNWSKLPQEAKDMYGDKEDKEDKEDKGAKGDENDSGCLAAPELNEEITLEHNVQLQLQVQVEVEAEVHEKVASIEELPDVHEEEAASIEQLPDVHEDPRPIEELPDVREMLHAIEQLPNVPQDDEPDFVEPKKCISSQLFGGNRKAPNRQANRVSFVRQPAKKRKRSEDDSSSDEHGANENSENQVASGSVNVAAIPNAERRPAAARSRHGPRIILFRLSKNRYCRIQHPR